MTHQRGVTATLRRLTLLASLTAAALAVTAYVALSLPGWLRLERVRPDPLLEECRGRGEAYGEQLGEAWAAYRRKEATWQQSEARAEVLARAYGDDLRAIHAKHGRHLPPRREGAGKERIGWQA